MVFRALLVLIAAVAFAGSPFLVPDFGGYDPSQFPVPQTNPPVQPAGYAFGIWGVIYLWLVAMAGFGLAARRQHPDWDRSRWPLIASLGVGSIWLSVAVVSPLWATVLIWTMLGTAIAALLRTPATDRWWLQEAVGLYAGWLTAASAVSIGLAASGWGIPPFAPEGWAIAALSLGLVIAVAVLTWRPVLSYGAAIVWALIAVAVRNGTDTVGIFALVAAAIIVAVTLGRFSKDRRAA
ncbi:MAG: hypothetical protein AAF919_00130 [Pseudomonadota bacterium]